MNKDEAKKRLETIKQEANELQKMIDAPELLTIRHGDYGIVPSYGGTKLPVLANPEMLNPEFDFWKGEDGEDVCCYTSINGKKIINKGNIFDDMKRNQTDLTEFTVACNVGAIIVDVGGRKLIQFNMIGWRDDFDESQKRRYNVSLGDAMLYHQKLGQLIAFMKRSQK